MNVAFTVRKEYFYAIERGEKDEEFRRGSKYWTTIAFKVMWALGRGETVGASFLCGGRFIRRELLRVTFYGSAEVALGRPPSPQGRKDLGDGPVIGFMLGKKVT